MYTVVVTDTQYDVVSGKVVLDSFDDELDATELAEYLNGGDTVPSYMKKKVVDPVKAMSDKHRRTFVALPT